MARKATAAADTAQRVLDVAERLVQTRGFNGFSYADIAAALGITKASLHYHFPTKADLGRRLIERYEHRFLEAVAAIDRSGADAREKLRRYAAIYVDVLRANRMCLCGMLASDYATRNGSWRSWMPGARPARCASRASPRSSRRRWSARSRARCCSRAPTATSGGSRRSPTG
jgi:AcrR family transcriptional regulator